MSNNCTGIFSEDNLSFKKSPILIYAGHACNEANLHFSKHKHDEFSELLYISDGEGEFIIEDKVYTAKKGDILIFNKGVFHEEFSNPNNPLNMYYCAIGNQSISGIAEGCLIPSEVEPLIHSQHHSSKMEYIISEIFNQCANQINGYLDICQNLISALVIMTLQIIIEQNKLFVADKAKSLGTKIKDYIDCNYKKDISLNEIAQSLFVSKHYLSHIFKNEIGYSPINYLINKRIEEAKKHLLNTNKSIQEISQLVGYENVNHFNILFKRVTGLTAGKYKESIKNDRATYTM